MYVCICNSVTDKAIKRAVKRGCNSYDKVCHKLKVASCCGRCEGHAREVVSEAITELNSRAVYQISPVLSLSN